MKQMRLIALMLYMGSIMGIESLQKVHDLYHHAHWLKEHNRHEDAIPFYTKIISLDRDHAFAHLGLAQCYLALGNFTQGLPGMQFRHPDIQHFEQYSWLAKDLTGKKILIRGEWGFGDMFQFIRYAQLLKKQGAQVYVQTYQELAPLFRLCPYIDHIITDGIPFPEHAQQVPLLSLPEQFHTMQTTIPATIPYLYADPTLIKTWQHYFEHEKRFKVGICWSGRGDSRALDYIQKNIPVSLLATLADTTNVVIYALQPTSEDLAHLPITKLPNTVDTEHGRFMDTAAIMCHLDLIISIDTSIAHLAGALGRPVWTLLPYTADWRWMKNTSHSAWYPTMHLFRQPAPGGWASVLQHINTNLQELVHKHRYYTELYDSRDIQALFNRGHEALKEGDLHYAEKIFEHILRTLPTSIATLHNLAYTYRWQGKLDLAEQTYQRELELEDRSDGWFGLAQTHLLAGNFEQGLPAFERGRAPTIGALSHRPHTLDELKGKSILILAEWGLGDMLQCIRYAQLLHTQGTTVLVQAPRPLQNLLRLCPYIDHIVCAGEPLGRSVDFQIPLLSLPHLFDTNLSTIPASIPYIYADQKLITHWSKEFKNDGTLRIGICWHGSTYKAYPDKNIPLELCKQLATVPGVSLYSLQKFRGAEELSTDQPAIHIHDFGNDFDTTAGAFMDTAAIMHHLDLIITIDTSIAHLAGALGLPTWILLPHVPDWRWMLERDDSPWYPTMRLFRQPQPGNWTAVIEKVRAALQEIHHLSDS